MLIGWATVVPSARVNDIELTDLAGIGKVVTVEEIRARALGDAALFGGLVEDDSPKRGTTWVG